MSARLQPRLGTADLAMVARLEAFTMAAVPARTDWRLPGWWCVADDGGHVGRANSATAVPVPTGATPASLSDVAASYRQRGLTPKVRWTPMAPATLAHEATHDGWLSTGEVVVMMTPVAAAGGAAAERYGSGGSSVLLSAPDAHWAGVYLAANADGSGPARLRLAEAAPEAKAYAKVEVDGATAAIGLGVVMDEVLGIFDVVTAPEHRRQGHARHVMDLLTRWGAERGAATAFLQVHGGNGAAMALYGSIGFTMGYTYVYLVQAGES